MKHPTYASATAGSPSSAKGVRPTHSAATPTVLLAGPWQTGEFAAVRDAIDPARQHPALLTLTDAIAHIETLAPPPEVVLLAQPRSGVDDQRSIDKLCELAPLTRVIVVAGAWCEGELRTGKPLANVIRLYWYEFPAWWRAACEKLAIGQCPMWSEPLVDVRSGTMVCIREGEAPAEPQGAMPASARACGAAVAIDTIDHSTFEALAAGLNELGWTCTWRPRHRPHIGAELEKQPPIAAVWDGSQLDERELDQLRNFCRRVEHTPVLALLDFPRAEHLAIAKAAGAAAILAKPCQLALLHKELLRCTLQPRRGDIV